MPQVQQLLTELKNTLQFNADAISQELAEYEAITEPTKLDGLRARAMGFYYSGNYEQAQPLMNALVAAEPNERNLLKLSKIHLRLGSYGEAREICERVSLIFPDSTEALGILAASRIEEGAFKEAVDLCNEGLTRDPGNERFRAFLILSQYAMSNTQEALAQPALNHPLLNWTVRNLATTMSPHSDLGEILEKLSNTTAIQLMSRSEPTK